MIRSLLRSTFAAPFAGRPQGSPVDTTADAAFNGVYQAQLTPAFKFARRKVGASAAEDVVHEAFADLWELCFRGEDLPAAPVEQLYYRILRRRIIDHLRVTRRLQSLPETSGEVAALGRPVQSRNEPEAETDGRGLVERLAFLVRALPQQMRSAYEITEYYDGDSSVAAALMGISENTVKSHCTKARQRLMDQLRRDGYEVPEQLETGRRLRRIK